MGHADDLRVSCKCSAVQSTRAHHDTLACIIIDPGQLDAGRGGEQSLPALAPGHAGALEHPDGEVVVEGVLASRVVAVHGHALEAVDPQGAFSHRQHDEQDEERSRP